MPTKQPRQYRVHDSHVVCHDRVHDHGRDSHYVALRTASASHNETYKYAQQASNAAAHRIASHLRSPSARVSCSHKTWGAQGFRHRCLSIVTVTAVVCTTSPGEQFRSVLNFGRESEQGRVPEFSLVQNPTSMSLPREASRSQSETWIRLSLAETFHASSLRHCPNKNQLLLRKNYERSTFPYIIPGNLGSYGVGTTG